MAPHRTNIEMSQPVPAECDAGADIIVKVKVSCPEGCDLRGIPVKVMAADEVVITRELATYDGAINETEAFGLKASEQVGEHDWTVHFPRYEIEGAVHEESSVATSLTTRPHATSMAVWDIPAPVVMNGSFTVKVGVKCSAMCQLAGRFVEVRDEAGTPIGKGRLGETPWTGTSALYVAEVELIAPATEGMASWSAGFAATEPGLPHDVASADFTFRTVRPPEYRVTVRVTDKEKAALENVDVVLGVYRASTDAQGVATLELTGGVYELDAWKVGYETLPTTVEVGQDLTIQIEASWSPEKNSDDHTVWM